MVLHPNLPRKVRCVETRSGFLVYENHGVGIPHVKEKVTSHGLPEITDFERAFFQITPQRCKTRGKAGA